MEGKRHIALPALLGAGLLLALLVGGIFFTRYLDRQIFVERTTQLVELTSQVRVNLDNALDSHWNYLTAAVNLLDERAPAGEADVPSRIRELEAVLETERYSSMLMLLDSRGCCYDREGSHGVWSDIDLLSGGEERCTFISDGYPGSAWAFVQKLREPLAAGGATFTHVALLKDIQTLSQYYDSTAYGSQNETYILKNNGTRMHDDLTKSIQAYNVLKALEEMEGQRCPDIRAALAEAGTVSTNFIRDGEEYYYCITSLEEYDTLLLFLIPARLVASGTVGMVGMVIRTLLVLAAGVLVLVALAAAAVIRQRASVRLVRQEQANLRRQEEMNARLEQTNAMLARSKETAEQAFRIAEQASRAKSSFLSNMSHDIRTPMNAIIGFAALLGQNAEDPEKVRAYTQKITASSQHLLGLINDVLDISKIEAGKTTLSLSDESIIGLMENLESIIRPQMKAKGHTFTVQSRDIRHEYVVMDQLRLNQILLNLLSNAMKYTPDGGNVSFTLQELPQQNRRFARFRFTVADNGYGMSEAFQETLFQTFTREEDSVTNKIQGTGLGMAITKNLLDLMGGTISVESEKGKGSTFTVELTLQVGEEGAPACAPVREPEEDAPSALEGLHILAAEDNAINAEILSELLDIAGAACDVYENGALAAEAFIASEPGRYQLVLMDVQMPVMNGYEATGAIRRSAHPEAKTIPIIAMTANAFAEDVRDALAAGMNAHVAKPVDMNVLEQAARSVLGK